MAARQFFFEDAAQSYFQDVRVCRQTEMKIEKSVIDGLNGQAERDLGGDLPFHLRETSHGADGHQMVPDSFFCIAGRVLFTINITIVIALLRAALRDR